MAQHGRRGITLQTIQRDPIPVTMVNTETGEKFQFDIRSSAEMSARDRKLLGNYVEAIGHFEATPDADLKPGDYEYAEEILENAARIGTRNLDMGRFNSLSFPDRLQIVVALATAFADEREAFTTATEQIQAVRAGQAEERPNLFSRLRGTMKTSQTQPQFSVVPSEDGPPTG